MLGEEGAGEIEVLEGFHVVAPPLRNFGEAEVTAACLDGAALLLGPGEGAVATGWLGTPLIPIDAGGAQADVDQRANCYQFG